jgi:hypothetical protein
VSGGRAEVILGRGSFTESFPLFGHSLDDYDDPSSRSSRSSRPSGTQTSPASPFTGRARCARRSKACASTRPSSTRRSGPGWASAAARSRWCARPATGSRSPPPSSAAIPAASRPTSSSITGAPPAWLGAVASRRALAGTHRREQ